jgi:hypothetical protein
MGMNINTGELAKFDDWAELEKAAEKGFVPLTSAEAKKARAILVGKRSAFLPKDDPLRQRVTRRVGNPATEKQMRAIRKHYAVMGKDAFWAWMHENAPDITPDTGLSCGQAQRVLNMLQAKGPELVKAGAAHE